MKQIGHQPSLRCLYLAEQLEKRGIGICPDSPNLLVNSFMLETRMFDEIG